MNSEPNQTGVPMKQGGFGAALRKSGKAIWRFLRKNWAWKLLSLVLAVCLWAGLITQDPTLTRERTFNDVAISVSGSDTLRRNGFIVLTGLEDANLTTRLRADVPQREYNTVSAANYNPRINLASITEAGEQYLSILTTSTTTYGMVEDVEPDSVKLLVDSYVTNYRVPVSVNVMGSYPEGFYGAPPSATPSIVAVSGPSAIVKRIARILVDLDLSRLTAQAGTVRMALPMRFMDTDGAEMDASLMDVTSSGVVLRTIVVEQQLYATRTLNVANAALTTGTPAEGYELRGVTAVPSTLIGAGDESKLTALDTLFIDNPVNLKNAAESFTVEVSLRKPSELVYVSVDRVTLYVEIVPKIITRTFKQVRIKTIGAAATDNVKLSVRGAALSVTGPQLTVEALQSSQLSINVDIDGFAIGTHELPLTVAVEDLDATTLATLSLSTDPSGVILTVRE